MIKFTKKTEAQPLPNETTDNRFDQIRKAASEKHRKPDADAIRRRDRQKAEDDQLL